MSPKTRLYLLRLDFTATEFSQTETNRSFWLISDDPNLGEEPFIFYVSGIAQLIFSRLMTGCRYIPDG